MGPIGEPKVADLGMAPISGFNSNTFLALPAIDVVSFAFERLNEYDPEQVIYADASNAKNRILAGSVKSTVQRLSAGLKAYGIAPGDCVCIHAFNSIWFPLLWLAVIASGGVATGSNPAYTSSELTHHFRITSTKYVVAQDDCLAAVKEAVSEGDVSANNVFVLGSSNSELAHGRIRHGFKSWKVLLKHEINENITLNDEKVWKPAVAAYAATSGTTGLPKAAELSHQYIVTQTSILEHIFSRRNEEIRQLVCLPVFHAFAAQLAIVLPLRLGITTYFMPRFNLADYLCHVYQLKITDSAVVPPIISSLLYAPSVALESLRYIICAGAPMTPAVQTKLYTNLHADATIGQCWGATEVGWISLFEDNERDYTGSVGRLLPNTTLKIVNEHGEPITDDDVSGEAFIQSSSMMNQYRNNPVATSAAFTEDGFYRTGDRAYVVKGKIYLDGRIKDIMKVNGWQVSPEEVEKVVLELADVTDCAVIGHYVVSKAGLEETKPRAYVVKKPESKITGIEIQDYVSKKLIRYKRLTGGVIFTDMLPRSNTGKILRRKLSGLPAEAEAKGHEESHSKMHVHAWTSYLWAIILIPLCCAMGPPGLILLCVGFKLVAGGKRHHI